MRKFILCDSLCGRRRKILRKIQCLCYRNNLFIEAVICITDFIKRLESGGILCVNLNFLCFGSNWYHVGISSAPPRDCSSAFHRFPVREDEFGTRWKLNKVAFGERYKIPRRTRKTEMWASIRKEEWKKPFHRIHRREERNETLSIKKLKLLFIIHRAFN